ncbi:hypothetical protein EH243_00130 [Amphritea opalescens]|uniref:DUF1236 domain-containing protein n=1 Tax=Amphritea opalescens TaxID=2490544 RepID=A0A430KVB6_9GAMM|nr:DUF6515 family protein [Amphritea opalescens]RTE67398.1 hypothetical protein EH243_00130 [Amphritea opalescens]
MNKLTISLLITSLTFATVTPLSAGPRPSPQPHGHHVDHLPGAAVTTVIAGATYWVLDSLFYRKANNGYVVVEPPKGSYYKRLPADAVVVTRHGRDYFRYHGAYYRWVPERKIYVIEPSIAEPETEQVSHYAAGSVLTTLPNGSNAISINGVQYFRHAGNYFLPSERNGKQVYVVVDID